jgi:hypothetical protein
VTDFLPPIVLPIEATIGKLIEELAKADAAIRAWAAGLPDTTRRIEPLMAGEGREAGEAFAHNLTERIDEGAVRAARQVSSRMHDERGRFETAGDEAGHRFGLGLVRSVRNALDRLLPGNVGGGTDRGGIGRVLAGIGGGVAGGAGLGAKMLFSGPGLITGLVFGAAQAIAAVAPAVGILNAIPAAVGPAVLSLGALLVAVHGVGTALGAGFANNANAFAKAMEKLTPPAREFVKTILALRPELHALHQDVQAGFFAGLSADVKALSGTYLPLMHTTLMQVAQALNSAVRSYTGWLKIPETIRSITTSLHNMVAAIQLGSHSLLGIVSGLNDMVEVGSRFLPRMGAWITNLADAFSEFMANAAASGQLQQWIEGGIEAFKLFGALLKDLWNILMPIIHVLNATTGGGLGFLGQLLHQLAEFFNSAPGIAFLTSLFKILASVFGLLAHAVVLLLPILGKVFTALEPLFTSGEWTALLEELASAFDQIVTALLPVLPPLIDLTIRLLPVLVPLLRLAADAIIAQTPALYAMAKALDLLAPALDWLAAQLNWVAYYADKLTGPTTALGESIIDAFFSAKLWKDVGAWFAGIGRDIGGFFSDAKGWFDDAAHWVAQLPGKVLAALAALPGILASIGRNATLRMAYAVGYGVGFILRQIHDLPHNLRLIIVDAWNRAYAATVSGLTAIAGWIRVTKDKVLATIAEWWHLAVADFRRGVDRIVGFVTGLKDSVPAGFRAVKDKVLDVFHDASTWLLNAGTDILKGLLRGMEKGAGGVLGFIGDIGHAIVKGFNDAVGNRSPSRLFGLAGENIIAGLEQALVRGRGRVVTVVTDMLDTVRRGGRLDLSLAAAGGMSIAGPRILGPARPAETVINLHVTTTLDGKVVAQQLIPHAQRTKTRTGVTGLA